MDMQQMASFGGGLLGGPPSPSALDQGSDYSLFVRQQPEYTKIATTKDRDRKPLDPPPVVQLHVAPPRDPNRNFLQNPYYFMMATLIKADDKDEKKPNPTALLGTVVSSIHRLKDQDNSDGGFFIFGDMSVKTEGHFRLLFTLFEIKNMVCEKLAFIESKPFQVYGSKGFPGLAQSTFLTRSFRDQGVRLRLRKDSRSQTTRRRNDAVAAWSHRFHGGHRPGQQPRGGPPVAMPHPGPPPNLSNRVAPAHSMPPAHSVAPAPLAWNAPFGSQNPRNLFGHQALHSPYVEQEPGPWLHH